jgi:alpha-beta hydrolase superfamily lysophospholipase
MTRTADKTFDLRGHGRSDKPDGPSERPEAFNPLLAQFLGEQ